MPSLTRVMCRTNVDANMDLLGCVVCTRAHQTCTACGRVVPLSLDPMDNASVYISFSFGSDPNIIDERIGVVGLVSPNLRKTLAC